jgi:putative transposase
VVVRTPPERAQTIELLALRHEVRVLRRQVKRTGWRPGDRLFLVALSRRLPRGEWRRLPVRPETVLRWHRELARREWAAFGQCRGPGRPPLVSEVRDLIARLAQENPTRGYRRIRGELLQFGHTVAATIQTVLRQRRVPPAPRRAGPSWPAFLRAHAEGLLACDFFTVETVRLRALYVPFFLDVHTRRVFVASCTTHPTAAWVTQQARDVCWDLAATGARPTVLLRDRDSKLAPAFDAVFAAQGIRVGRTPARTPQANALAERWVGTIRRECLDWLLITDERHLDHVLREFAAHYNSARPHRALRLQPPLGPRPHCAGSGEARRRDRLGGLLHEYQRAAA